MRKRGYKIVERNFNCRVGEIDLVARQGQTLVFVEVRHRSSSTHGEASETVTPTKQKRLIAAAYHYLAKNPHDGDIRFDVVAFTADDAQVIVSAFEA